MANVGPPEGHTICKDRSEDPICGCRGEGIELTTALLFAARHLFCFCLAALYESARTDNFSVAATQKLQLFAA
jgi:hypothetical protein